MAVISHRLIQLIGRTLPRMTPANTSRIVPVVVTYRELKQKKPQKRGLFGYLSDIVLDMSVAV